MFEILAGKCNIDLTIFCTYERPRGTFPGPVEGLLRVLGPVEGVRRVPGSHRRSVLVLDELLALVQLALGVRWEDDQLAVRDLMNRENLHVIYLMESFCFDDSDLLTNNNCWSTSW